MGGGLANDLRAGSGKNVLVTNGCGEGSVGACLNGNGGVAEGNNLVSSNGNGVKREEYVVTYVTYTILAGITVRS